MFKNMWADHADLISLLYSGTGLEAVFAKQWLIACIVGSWWPQLYVSYVVLCCGLLFDVFLCLLC